jgi:RNA polymerase sigma-70 factor (ECF subfamily)
MDDEVAHLVATVRHARPEIELPPDGFAARLAELVVDEEDPRDALGRLRAADLYLAWACGAGSPPALAIFERELMALVPSFVAHLGGGAAFADEVRQRLRMKLFVGDAPKIGEYTGRGALGGWVRVVALRVAADLLRASGKLVAAELDETALDPAAPIDVQYLKARYREHFEDALQAAIGALSKKHRNLLRMHYVDGITLDKLASMYRVHAATISRWLADARDDVVAGTHERLAERFDLSPSELDSIVELVRSQIQVSVERLFTGRARAT